MLLKRSCFPPNARRQLIEAFCLCESIVKQGMLHSRGELLLMLDADGATKVDDLEKLENQVCTGLDHISVTHSYVVLLENFCSRSFMLSKLLRV